MKIKKAGRVGARPGHAFEGNQHEEAACPTDYLYVIEIMSKIKPAI